jgi:hypothetical protein
MGRRRHIGMVDFTASYAQATFVEFGVEHYAEANTPFLLQHRNWRGLIADISAEAIETVRRSDLMWRHDLTAVHLQITRDNINDLLTDHGFAGEIGVLSVDVDGIDYWIWDAITVSNPGIIICEYNGLFGDRHPLSVQPDDNFNRTEKHFSNLYWRSSILRDPAPGPLARLYFRGIQY